jgi:hypothetical protein
MDIEEINTLVSSEIKKRPSVWYVDIPYLDGQFLERLSILTPAGKVALQEFKIILESLNKGGLNNE